MARRDVPGVGPEGATGPKAAWREALRSVRLQMVLLTFALMLITGLAAALVSINAYRAQDRLTTVQLSQTATALSLAVDGKIRESAGELKTLALWPGLATGDLRGFDRVARREVVGGDRWVVLVDDQGRLLVDTALAPGASAPPLPSTLFQAYRRRVGAGEEIYVSDLFSGSLTRRPVVGVMISVPPPGPPTWRLGIVMAPSVPQQILVQQGLPPGWWSTLNDRQGRTIARSVDPARWVGRLAPPKAREIFRRHAEGVFESPSLEGRVARFAYKRSPLTGWILVVSMPKAAAQAALVQYLATSLVLVLGLLLLGVALVWRFGGRVARAIDTLAQAAQALGPGAPAAPTATGLSEIDAVGCALHDSSVRLKQREAKIRRLVDSNIIGIFVWNLDGRILEANDAFLALVGYDREDLLAERMSWIEMTPPEWWDATQRGLDELKATGRYEPFEKEFLRKDGSRVPVLLGGAEFNRTAEEGVAFVLDLSERRAMVNELNHRVKNTLATVRAISAQTLRTAPTPEAFRAAFQDRLAALSRTHDLLNRTSWTGVSLRDLAEQAVAPHEKDGQVLLAGEDVRLGPVAAVTLGMALHELAANAAKYGALATPSGHVRVAWRPSAPGRLQLVWEELGGPLVQPPTRRGFGSELIQKVLAAELRGEVRLEFPSQGVRCTMDMALHRVCAH